MKVARRDSQELIRDMMFYRSSSPFKLPSRRSSFIYSESCIEQKNDKAETITPLTRCSETESASGSNITSVDASTDTNDLIYTSIIRTYQPKSDDFTDIMYCYLYYMRDAHTVYKKSSKEHDIALEKAFEIYDNIQNNLIHAKMWYNHFFDILDDFIKEQKRKTPIM